MIVHDRRRNSAQCQSFTVSDAEFDQELTEIINNQLITLIINSLELNLSN